jgi:hypothetical protein
MKKLVERVKICDEFWQLMSEMGICISMLAITILTGFRRQFWFTLIMSLTIRGLMPNCREIYYEDNRIIN